MLQKTSRITLDLSADLAEVLTRLAKNLDGTKAQALRRMVVIGDYLITHKNDGWELTLVRGDEKKEIIIL